MRARLLSLVTLAVSLAACTDREDPIATAPVPPSGDSLAVFLTVAPGAHRAGDEVTVDVRARRGADAPAIGSFTFDIAYDTAAVEFVRAGEATDGMTMANATAAGVRLAGASGTGFQTERLASIVVRLRGSASLESLQLSVGELNTVAFADARRVSKISPRVFTGESGIVAR